ncbi:hypothetical protein FQU54_25360 [Salmonella enterica subsp. diarizonae]|nr:hypothetical protein [Salmonella enterica subsp. diarizonae]EDY5734548.1 hypothetical protein [Salmonella enterica]
MKNDFDEDMKTFIDIWLIEQDQNVIGESLVEFYINHRYDKKSLELFSKIVACMSLKSMRYTIHKLIKGFECSGLPLTRVHKKEIALSILISLSKMHNIDFDSYRAEMIRSISGYYLKVEKMG